MFLLDLIRSFFDKFCDDGCVISCHLARLWRFSQNRNFQAVQEFLGFAREFFVLPGKLLNDSPFFFGERASELSLPV